MLTMSKYNYCIAISCEWTVWSRILRSNNLSLSEVISWKKSKKTKSNVLAIAWTPSVTNRPICRWLKPQTNKLNWRKKKRRWKQKLLVCAKFTARNSAKKRKSWWRCRSNARLPKKSRPIWASWRRAFADWWWFTRWLRWVVKWAWTRWLDFQKPRSKLSPVVPVFACVRGHTGFSLSMPQWNHWAQFWKITPQNNIHLLALIIINAATFLNSFWKTIVFCQKT